MKQTRLSTPVRRLPPTVVTGRLIRSYVRWLMGATERNPSAVRCGHCGAVTINPDVRPLRTFDGYREADHER